jgi:hypothetical protein
MRSRARENQGIGAFAVALAALAGLDGCGKSTDGEGDAGEGAVAGNSTSGTTSGSGKGGSSTGGKGGSGGTGNPAGTANAGRSGSGNTSGNAGADGGAGTNGEGGAGNDAGAESAGGAEDAGSNAGGSGGAATTCMGDVTIADGDDLTAFAARGCVVLDGTLTIQTLLLEDLGALSPSPLRTINESLYLNGNAELVQIEGLAGLERILGSLVIEQNARLGDLGGLENVVAVGSDSAANTLVVSGNPALVNLEALGAATNGALSLDVGLVVTDNDALTSLRGVSGLTSTSNVLLANNPALTEIGGLEDLVESGNVTVASNTGLETSDFPALEAVDTLSVTASSALTSLSLPSLATVRQNITIASNPLLTTLGSLDALTDVETMTIAANPMLPQCFVDALDQRLGGPCGGGCMGNDTTASCD